MNWLFGSDSTQRPKDNVPVRALPSTWYHSPAMYELERRAIFSKKWMVVSHSCRFPAAGDYVRYTEAGFTFFVIKDRKGSIRAHHNVCRHRAYPVVEADSGNARILSCKYHGKHLRAWPPRCYSLIVGARMVVWSGWRARQSAEIRRLGRIR